MKKSDFKVGDYFNKTIKETNGNETWDNQNRFKTFLLTGIVGESWQYVELWYEYSKGDYPFLGTTTTWNVPEDLDNENFVIEKINDPETEGFKDKKKFLPELIRKRIKSLKENYDTYTKAIGINVIRQENVEDIISYIEKLEEITMQLRRNGYKGIDYAISNYIDFCTFKLPLLSFNHGNKFLTGTVQGFYYKSQEFAIEVDGQEHLVNMKDILPNRELYPIDFAYVKPWSSVFGKCEIESLAKRILRYTESWSKPITWEEYYETMTDGDKAVDYLVKRDFDLVMPYLKSPETCAEFSTSWKEIVDKHLKNHNNEFSRI